MARRKEEYYVFDASARTIKIPGHINLNDLLTVINVTSGVVIYSFGDPGKGATRGHAHPLVGADPDFPYSIDGTCTFTFEYDTTSMSDDDELLIYIEDERKGLTVRPFDYAVDAVERIKVSQGESLIDADFEYGLQSSKWQNVGFNSNYPSFSEPTGNPLTVSSVSSNGANPSTITVTVQTGQSLAANTAFSIVGLSEGSALAEGSFIVSENVSTTQFRYQAKGQVTGVSATPYTTLRPAAIFDQAGLSVAEYSSTNPNQFVTLTFSEPHGLIPGSPFILIDSAGGIQTQEGPYFVSRVLNSLQFEYDTPGITQSSATVTTGLTVYAVSNATFVHRPFDGGVLLSTFYPIAGLDAKRQTKRYFRYQSGKGINFSTGTLLTPIFDITAASYSGSAITVTTEVPHGFQVGVKVALSDIESVGYDTTLTDYVYQNPYEITSITNEYTFVIGDFGVGGVNEGLDTGIVDSVADLGLEPKCVALNWKGSLVRTGMFDDSNGFYWEYDGSNLSAVVRTSTNQISGTVALVSGSSEIVGTNTRFGDQVIIGDKIQIKGQIYEVCDVESSTVLHVNPAYRGVNASNTKISLVTERRIKSHTFNFDTIDGHGPSGYKIHVDRMQMFGIQWSWYGAGYVDFQVRGPLGDWITAHRVANANFQTEAYLRTGNLPARYEVSTSCRHSKVITSATGTSGDFTVLNADHLFPTDGGTLLLTSVQGSDILSEVINYTSISGNTIQGTTRGSSYTRFINGSNRTFSGTTTPRNHPVGTAVRFIGSNLAPTISHWGSSVIMDGQFKEDSGFNFTASTYSVTVAAGTTETVLLFRPAPAVSNTLVGNVGERELINRSRLQLQSLEVNNVGDPRNVSGTQIVDPRRIEIIGILNPSNLDPAGITWSNASSFAYGTATTGYQPSFAQYNNVLRTDPADGEILFKFITSKESELFDISTSKELQNSILGGNGLFPNGPEMVAFAITNKSGFSTTVDVILTWQEAQA